MDPLTETSIVFPDRVAYPVVATKLDVWSPLYTEVLDDIVVMVKTGLPACGLACQIMQNMPWDELRANCHAAIDDVTLSYTRSFYFEHAHSLREDNRLLIDVSHELFVFGMNRIHIMEDRAA